MSSRVPTQTRMTNQLYSLLLDLPSELQCLIFEYVAFIQLTSHVVPTCRKLAQVAKHAAHTQVNKIHTGVSVPIDPSSPCYLIANEIKGNLRTVSFRGARIPYEADTLQKRLLLAYCNVAQMLYFEQCTTIHRGQNTERATEYQARAVARALLEVERHPNSNANTIMNGVLFLPPAMQKNVHEYTPARLAQEMSNAHNGYARNPIGPRRVRGLLCKKALLVVANLYANPFSRNKCYILRAVQESAIRRTYVVTVAVFYHNRRDGVYISVFDTEVEAKAVGERAFKTQDQPASRWNAPWNDKNDVWLFLARNCPLAKVAMHLLRV